MTHTGDKFKRCIETKLGIFVDIKGLLLIWFRLVKRRQFLVYTTKSKIILFSIEDDICNFLCLNFFGFRKRLSFVNLSP